MTMIWADAAHLEDLKQVIKTQQKKLADMQDALDASYKALTNAQCDIAYSMPHDAHLVTFMFTAEMVEFKKHTVESLMQVVSQRLVPYLKDLQEKTKNGGS
jgi:hypothetical protein